MYRRNKGTNIVLFVAVVVALIASLLTFMPQTSRTAPAPTDSFTQPESGDIPLPKVDSVPRSEPALPKVDSVPHSEPAEQPEKSYSYVLNTNTMRIHKPSCSSVTEMNPKNRQYTEESIEALEAEGYVKCKRCF